jgi:hypothetical protein
MSIYVLFGCSIVVVIVVMWGNCLLGSFLRILEVLFSDLHGKLFVLVIHIK